MALVMATILFRTLGQLWQLVVTVMVTTASLCLHLWYKPHAIPKLQLLENLSMVVSLVTFMLAQLLLATGNQGPDNPIASLVVTVIVLVCNVAFVIVFIVTLRQEVAAKVRRWHRQRCHTRPTCVVCQVCGTRRG